MTDDHRPGTDEIVDVLIAVHVPDVASLAFSDDDLCSRVAEGAAGPGALCRFLARPGRSTVTMCMSRVGDTGILSVQFRQARIANSVERPGVIGRRFALGERVFRRYPDSGG